MVVATDQTQAASTMDSFFNLLSTIDIIIVTVIVTVVGSCAVAYMSRSSKCHSNGPTRRGA
jgi:heme/copper-type cytochrome/quinol oxidase subunit 2